jgi:hypothetical protein
MVVSMSEKEFSRLSVLMDTQSDKLRRAARTRRFVEQRGVSFQLCRKSAVTMPLVLERERRFRIVAIRQAQENEFWPLAKDRKRRRDALGFGKAVEALMKIYHAFIFGRLVRLAGSKANQFAAQRGEGFSLHDPDDDIEFRKKRPCLSG